MTKVITRFPPSPTGYFHIGSARTALFNYLFALQNKGVMHLRFEDTDKERSKKEFEEDIIEGLQWLGISYAAETHRQSERATVYQAHVKALIDKGFAYEAEASTADANKKVVRFKNPNTTIRFADLVRGEVSFDTTELKDFIVAKSVDEPLYHLAVVIDDAETGVTHVIRGEDHISNTPRQILILEALGFERPQYAHIPLILAPDRSKLSKRHGAVSVNEYRRLGFLPQALINYLALLGWNPGDERELFSMQELAAVFGIARIQKGGAIFDMEKLRWFNREHLLRLSEKEFSAAALPILEGALKERGVPWNAAMGERLVPVLRERISVWSDIDEAVTEGEFDYLFKAPGVKAAQIPFKDTSPAATVEHLKEVRKRIAALPSSTCVDPALIKAALWEYADKEGRGAVLWPLRFSLTGKEKSPDPFSVISILAQDEALARIDSAIELLKDHG